MTVTRLVIEEKSKGHPELEEALLASHAATLGIPVLGVTRKPFTRHRFESRSGDVIAGSVPFIRGALQSLGVQLPPQTPYPPVLAPYLHRKVWELPALGEALALGFPVFIRPAKRWKRFTGFVADSPNPAEVYGVSRREPVWCSDVVTWRSEWRCYVVRGEVRFVGLAATMRPMARLFPVDLSVVHEAVAQVNGPSAYAIDFGVLSTGETALIEMNDGFSVGAYDGVPADVYFDMMATRWMELTAMVRLAKDGG